VIGFSQYAKIDLASPDAILIFVWFTVLVYLGLCRIFSRNVNRKNCSFRCSAAAENSQRSTQCASATDFAVLSSLISQSPIAYRLLLTGVIGEKMNKFVS